MGYFNNFIFLRDFDIIMFKSMRWDDQMDFEEKVLSKKKIFDGKVVHLDEEQVELPNGKTAKREIIRHQGAVGVIAVTDSNKLVLIRQWRAPFGQVTLEIPAGKIEADEQDNPKLTAKRELNEETRFAADEFELITKFYTSPGFADEMMYLYHAVNLKQVSEALPQDDDEFLELVEFSPEEVQAAIQRGEICDAKTLMAIMFWQMMG